MGAGLILVVAVFVAVSSFIFLISLIFKKGQDPVAARVDDFARRSGAMPPRQAAVRPPTGPGSVVTALLPTSEAARKTLGDRLIQAGLYRRNSVTFYVATKIVLMILPLLLAILAATSGFIPLRQALLLGIFTGVAGTIVPSIWLDIQKRKRQVELRRALPDAVDVIVICVEAGLSLPAALVRVSKELATAHPMLAAEMIIVQREIQMGYSTGQALRRFADRFDVEELRSLSTVVEQAEKYGASIVKALRVHADSLRHRRFQRAEERARQASVKLLVPTILFIFPALFVVLIGPAVHDIFEMILRIAESTKAQ